MTTIIEAKNLASNTNNNDEDNLPPSGSAGKESTYNEGDLGSICGMGISPGGGHGNPLRATHSNNLAWRIPTYKGAWRAAVQGVAKSRT